MKHKDSAHPSITIPLTPVFENKFSLTCSTVVLKFSITDSSFQLAFSVLNSVVMK